MNPTPVVARAAALAAACCSMLSAAPTITGVANAAANIPLNYPIAQGAIFVIYGSGLGPANISVASSPFQSTTLSGTSVSVTVGGTTVNALMYYTSATQVAGLLPSNTPTGSGTWTVTYNSQASAAFTHGIGPNSFGIFTVDSSGQGAAIVTYPDYSLVSPVKATNCGGPNTTCGAANPGDTLILWGTGLGAVNGTDASGAGLGQNMPNIPVMLWLGGVQAPVTYQGRSGCCVGEDQIVFTVPNNVPAGCAVPLSVQIGTVVSNTGLMAVANGSRNCTPVNPALAALGATTIEQIVIGGPVSIASLNLTKLPNGSSGYQDNARFNFFRVTALIPGTQPFFLSDIDDPPIGTCVVYSNTNGNNDFPAASAADLNAGSSFTIQGPNGMTTVGQSSLFGGNSTTISSAGTFLVPGNFTVTGTGGADIGAFTAKFTLTGLPTTTGPANNTTVTRASGMTVTWTPAPSGNVWMQVGSATDSSLNSGFSTVCVAPASAGTFTIPAYALLPHLPGNFSFVQLYSSQSFSFTAPGANAGTVNAQLWGPSIALTLK
ncbi:MAG TPA: hypothetical protein VKB88_07085 [Bryobacteraceae bacterium]|nr:hypothetical protein [Bryobacteraceae bacterium]